MRFGVREVGCGKLQLEDMYNAWKKQEDCR